jgi:hypothetical protein
VWQQLQLVHWHLAATRDEAAGNQISETAKGISRHTARRLKKSPHRNGTPYVLTLSFGLWTPQNYGWVL